MRRTKVLVIDDARVNIKQIQSIISVRSSLEVISTRSNQNIIDLLDREGENIALIILGNCHTDKITQEDLLKHISNSQDLSHLPLIVMVHSRFLHLLDTFQDKNLAESIIQRTGNFGVLIKPFTDTEFLEAVQVANNR